MAHHDDPQKMEKLRLWIAEVENELGLKGTLAPVQKDLLKLISTVAHGPSRPGAPLTAYLLGYLAGSQPSKDPLDIIESIQKLAEKYESQ
ncbi:DUF6457 domain-containing protein [Arcanobacterium bovis]|uniref:Molybdopterin-guanine dinucleotide biosynthesis protein n=1 Tax=Arcanobacterium bovis TaxID=2529275 RepID=A0A4V2KR78_9ACTO|nr:DUF6457 domain-containing protein [Arcanobacterium bovis]TBW22779.1 molybdopterin-guanine dinucleotide biosynthesis protein [Arcanobacterium bovis]